MVQWHWIKKLFIQLSKNTFTVTCCIRDCKTVYARYTRWHDRKTVLARLIHTMAWPYNHRHILSRGVTIRLSQHSIYHDVTCHRSYTFTHTIAWSYNYRHILSCGVTIWLSQHSIYHDVTCHRSYAFTHTIAWSYNHRHKLHIIAWLCDRHNTLDTICNIYIPDRKTVV